MKRMIVTMISALVLAATFTIGAASSIRPGVNVRAETADAFATRNSGRRVSKGRRGRVHTNAVRNGSGAVSSKNTSGSGKPNANAHKRPPH